MAKIDNLEVRYAILNKYNSKCAYCGTDLTIKSLTIDHIEPLKRHIRSSKIDLNKIENFNPCCGSCNSSKSSFNIDTWRGEILKMHDRLLRDVSQYRLLNRLGIIENKESFNFYFETFQNNG